MSRHVALLRGINVGGKNKLKMTDLADLFATAGGGDVRTFIQSGNVLFSSEEAAAVVARAESALAAALGQPIPVVWRTAEELRSVPARNPFVDSPVEQVHIAFLRDLPADTSRLDPQRSPGDHLALVEREVFLHLPNGVARTRITNDWLDRVLGTVSTVRSWRTLGTLCDLLA